MAALQGANMVEADSRCSSNGTSSLFAFLKVMKKTDTFGNPSFLISVRTHDNAGIEPIDSLQKIFNKLHASCIVITSIETANDHSSIDVYPNPVDHLLTIHVTQSTERETSFIISDVLGKKMTEGRLKKEISIDMTSWNAGIYLLETSDGNKRKIVKQ